MATLMVSLMLTASYAASDTLTDLPKHYNICGEGLDPCPKCEAPVVGNKRLRREFRSLDDETWYRFAYAIWTMKALSYEEGSAKYGPAFRTYDWFVAKHCVGFSDIRGDMAHFQPAFQTWHGAAILELENSLLAIDPQIGAIPYWDPSVTEPSFFDNKYFGSNPGTGPDNTVTDGKFPNFPVKRMTNISESEFSPYIKADVNNYFGNGGWLRGSPSSKNTAPYVVRKGVNIVKPKTAYEKCLDLDAHWYEWYQCIEMGYELYMSCEHDLKGQQNPGECIHKLFSGDLQWIGGSLHGGIHINVGGGDTPVQGDFHDITSSPNDPFFWMHHVNTVRQVHAAMLRNKAQESMFYGFPTKNIVGYNNNYNKSFYGMGLNDVIAEVWPFRAADVGIGYKEPGTVLTNADMVCFMSPEHAPYTYDNFPNGEHEVLV